TGLSLHAEAADWYRQANLPLPSNCFVAGNPPKPLDETGGSGVSVTMWSNHYVSKHIRQHGDFHICEKIFCELIDPPRIDDSLLKKFFGRVPGTRTPGQLSAKDFVKLIDWLAEETVDYVAADRLKSLSDSIVS